MDRKTLEYMEERAKKARKIANRIEDLTKKALKVEKATRCYFDSTTHGFYVEEDEFHLVNKMKSAFADIVAEEIERLEQELAEL
jgi:lysophospholipase L1-like esterase